MILEQLGVCMEKNVLSWWPSSHICLWELDCEKGRTPKNLCLWTVVLEKTPESFLDSKEIKPVNLRVNQPWILIGRTDAESKAPIFWSPDANSWLTRKVPDAGKDWGQKEKSMSEDEMAGWYHQAVNMNLGKLRKTMRGQGGLECCSSCGRKELDTTGRLNNNNEKHWSSLMAEW